MTTFITEMKETALSTKKLLRIQKWILFNEDKGYISL